MSHEIEYSFEYMDSLFYVNGGVLYWKVRKSRNTHANSPAGCLNSKGYLQVKVDGYAFRVHRIIYLLQTGAWPNGEIDHINGDKTDNRMENLYACTTRQNQQNRAVHRKGKLPGVYFNKGSKKWGACIQINGKTKHLGYYQTELDGYQAYLNTIMAIGEPMRKVG